MQSSQQLTLPELKEAVITQAENRMFKKASSKEVIITVDETSTITKHIMLCEVHGFTLATVQRGEMTKYEPVTKAHLRKYQDKLENYLY